MIITAFKTGMPDFIPVSVPRLETLLEIIFLTVLSSHYSLKIFKWFKLDTFKIFSFRNMKSYTRPNQVKNIGHEVHHYAIFSVICLPTF